MTTICHKINSHRLLRFFEITNKSQHKIDVILTNVNLH